MGRLADHATVHLSAGPAAIRLNVLFCRYLEFSRGDVGIATRPNTARRELLCGHNRQSEKHALLCRSSPEPKK
jgi:hypothetical protein